MTHKEGFIDQEPHEKAGRKFFEEAFAQTKEQPFRHATKVGKHLEGYKEIYESYKERIAEINPNLPQNILLLPPIAIEQELIDSQEKKKEFEQIRQSYAKAIDELTQRDITPDFMKQKLETGILTEPSVIYEQNGRTCYLTTYRMVFNTITGANATETNILQAAHQQGVLIRNNFGRIADGTTESLYKDVEDHNLLSVFQTPAFKKEFPDTRVGVVKLTGADFNDIKTVVDTVQTNLNSDRRTISSFFIPSYASAVITHGWHHGVLLSADENTVTAREPFKLFEGRKNKEYGKEDFVKRWGKAHLRGDLIFAIKENDVA